MWSFTLSILAIAGLSATLVLLFLAVPYFFLGTFQYSFLRLEITPLVVFFALTTFRYLRLFVNTVRFCLYRPAPRAIDPKYSRRDVTVVCPTIEPDGDIFRRCCQSVCEQKPRAFYIVVGRPDLIDQAERVSAALRIHYTETDIEVHCSPDPGKRIQIHSVINRITTPITFFIDDHVFWNVHDGGAFLTSTLAAFEHENVYLVGTNKHAQIEANLGLWKRFWNFIGVAYLIRHNFEATASTWIDGGIFAVSGRTQAIRSELLHDPEFRHEYLHEMFGLPFMEKWGPLAPDDDNFITRYVFQKGYDVRIQAEPDALVTTTLGWFPKHLYTCLRWSRTTMRSNPRTLLMSATYRRQPWSVYAVYISGMLNYALLWDPTMVYLYIKAGSPFGPVIGFVAFVLATKTIKLLPHFIKYPSHILFFPAYVLFAYYHSLIKAYSLITWYDGAWSGRKAEDIVGKQDPSETEPLLPTSQAGS